ncbi:TRAP transporter large permease subunit [Hydrogenophaga sp. 2FB]|uniref:TRAP transporter large permease n=1 Tax=Hydrogenophaga sp. 2FB TaxID=2502187 RepID=UPI0010F71481|nr:TRAP transporter large permease subunit [Hydrogenophaga sp. 2FB]
MTIGVFVFSLLGCMAIGMPIAFALLLSGIALMWHLDNFETQIVAQNLINGADSFSLLAVPFFLLAGEVMNKGGLSRRIVNIGIAMVGHLPGGLGYVVIVAACIMAALSGSAVADAAALTAVLYPMMVRAGHDPGKSAGLIAAGGIIAPVIPPSIGFIIFGVAAGVSISKLFIAGLIPGLMLGVALAVTWWLQVRKDKVQPMPRATKGELAKAIADGAWALALPAIIIFGLKFGVFTPTEAGVVCAVYALFVTMFIYRELHWRQLYDVLAAAGQTTAVVMFLAAASLLSAWMITIADIPAQLTDLLEPLLQNKILLMLAIQVLVVVVGTALDMTPAILILTPILMPVVKAAGIDPVYFGVLFIMNNAIGLITPPVGAVLNVVCGVARIKMERIIAGVWPFLVAQCLVLLLLTLFPPLVMVPAAWLMGR